MAEKLCRGCCWAGLALGQAALCGAATAFPLHPGAPHTASARATAPCQLVELPCPGAGGSWEVTLPEAGILAAIKCPFSATST